MLEALKGIYESSAFQPIIDGFLDGGWRYLVMYAIVAVLFYLGIVRKFEPLLLLPIAFGMLLTNIPTISDALYHSEIFIGGEGIAWFDDHQLLDWATLGKEGGLLDYLYLGVKLGIFPPLIFLGVGAMTDFSPLIANPKSLLLGAAAQFGVFAAFIGALLLGFTVTEAASIGIIGGADGPTAIYVTKTLAPTLLGAIAVAAYSYMALVPMIQPPIMKAFTSKKERMVKMDVLRPVSKTEQVIFPIVVALVVCAILPSALPLVGMLMLGNLLRVSGVTERLSKTAQNELMNIVTIMLGVCVGATAKAETFLAPQTLYIILLGLCAFAFATLAGVLFGKVMYYVTGGKINPLIGSAGVSAVPMAARVSQKVGQAENPSNFLLMHAMGPNVAGVIGSAVAAGVFLTLFKF